MHTLILLLLIFAHCIVYGSVEEEHPSLDPPPSIVVTLSCHFIGEEYILAANASALFSPGPGFGFRVPAIRNVYLSRDHNTKRALGPYDLRASQPFQIIP